MSTTTVADAYAAYRHERLYTSTRGGEVVEIMQDGDDWYILVVKVPLSEQKRYSVPPTRQMYVRGTKVLYVGLRVKA